MLLEAFGFLLSSCLVGLFLLLKLTGDLYPRSLKKFLYRLALKNWIHGLPNPLDLFNVVSPKSTRDTGIFPCTEETELESPKTIQSPGEGDDLLFYGIDDSGNCIIVRNTRFLGNVAEGSILLHINGRKFKGTFLGQGASNEFGVGTLKLELVEAMKVWRLWFNGPLQEDEIETSLVHASINLLWKPLSGPSDLQKNANISLLSEHLATGKFGTTLFDLKFLVPEGYKQFGSLFGNFNIDGEESPKPFTLYGHRLRRSLKVPSNDTETVPESFELFAMCGSDGNAFSLTANNGAWIDGDLAHVSSEISPIQAVGADARDFNTNHSIPKFFTFEGLKSSHRVDLWPALESDSVGALQVVPLTLGLNAGKGRGILIRGLNHVTGSTLGKLKKTGGKDESGEARTGETQKESDFVDLESEECLQLPLVGGKGASLAALVKLVKEKSLNNEFKTSPGFCVTTNFFRRILNLKKFEEIFENVKNDTDLDAACLEVQQLILTAGVEDKVGPLVSVWVHKAFVECQEGNVARLKADRFAVRSSGTLEDGADLSCAGQNETFLGVKEENIGRKVVECWASLFTSQSVRYRLNHGQPAVSDMGVVVQAMVNATAAGVIFSADPITGNPFEILINANYGLGESVVSASCDPDTIIVARSRDGFDDVSIKSIALGAKKSKIVLNENGGGSTQEVHMSEAESQSCCISDSAALQLGQIAIKLVQSNDGKPLDIEWAVAGDQIYILQSRNITSLDAWTDFEISHEFDTAQRTQFEILTTANVGEVMPGATSPLSLSVVTKTLDFCIQQRFLARYNTVPSHCTFQTMAVCRQRLFMNVLQTMYRHVDAEINPPLACVDLAICGHVVINEEMHKLAVARWGVDSPLMKIKALAASARDVYKNKKIVVETSKRFQSYKLDLSGVENDSEALYRRITDETYALVEIAWAHCRMSEGSTTAQILSFVILSEGKKVEEWDSGLYTDVSKISSVCSDVESADIPTAMDKLAERIVAEGEEAAKLVSDSSDEDSLSYLLNHKSLRGAYDEFMDKHGHRCISELDLMRQSWKLEPLAFIGLLKSIVSSKSKYKGSWKSTAKVQFPNDDALLDSLDTKIKGSTRKILKFILPYARESVYSREKTKSLLVWVGNQLKLAYNALGEQLVRDQLISHPKMVYFFTHHELGQIISRSPNSPRILYKAMRREKLHHVLRKEEYPEFSTGTPVAIDNSIPIELGDQIKATPVSSGKIQGIAKVCNSVEEAAKLIQPGDILVTYATDIGWSPFFPILGGVVTELGGLISHGAVVAREYGLPCIVGATHATKIFKTGDTVLLNATEGTLSKVKLQDS